MPEKPKKLAAGHAEPSPGERHKMHITVKKLRYMLGFFAALPAQRRLKPYLAALSRLLDELGLNNDHVTVESLIAVVLKEPPTGPVHGWVTRRHALLVGELPEALQILLA